MKVIVYIPTLNAGEKWPLVIEKLQNQTYPVTQRVIIDSGSNDGTLERIDSEGFKIIKIDKRDFDHGGTRQMAVEKFSEADIYVFHPFKSIFPARITSSPKIVPEGNPPAS